MRTQVRTEDVAARPRCSGCGKGLGFDEWSAGLDACSSCRRDAFEVTPAATFVRGPRVAPPRGPIPGPPRIVTRKRPRQESIDDYARLLDDIPDELVDELVAALEAEAAKVPAPGDRPASALHDVLEDVGFGHTAAEFQWAAWGFAIGFSANIALAKYAQMTTGGSMAEFILPMFFGGIAAGTACAVIGWGLARLRDRG